jgi:hypothetical protein
MHDARALEAMLEARASPRRELVILILGWTNGKAQIAMRDEGLRFIHTQVASLAQHGLPHYLVLTPNLGDPRRKDGNDNMCLNFLRPQGVCCAFSSVGFAELQSSPFNRGNNSWEMFATHPYLLFLQRWWFTAHAVARGVSILSLDADLHLSANPLELVSSPALASYDVLFQGDGAWPVRRRRTRASAAAGTAAAADLHRPAAPSRHPHARRPPVPAAEAYRDGDEVEVTCSRGAARAYADDAPCPCNVTAAPGLNTGFVFARGATGTRGAALFNATVNTILERLRSAPIRDTRGVVHKGRLWPQAVMNEVVSRHARLPSIWSSGASSLAANGDGGVATGCHPHDVECQPWKLPPVPDPLGVLMPRAWWVQTPRTHSVWLASEAVGSGCRTPPRNHPSAPTRASLAWHRSIWPEEDYLLAHTDVHMPPPPKAASTPSTLPAAPLRVAVLPRPVVGRLCGMRKIPISTVRTACAVQPASPHLPTRCSARPRPLLPSDAWHP